MGIYALCEQRERKWGSTEPLLARMDDAEKDPV